MSEALIRCEQVSKKFCRSLKKSLWYGLTDATRDLLPLGASDAAHHRNANLRTDEFWANHDVSFELKRGECLGLVGRNGAGKTTLLKMLTGLIKPDRGRIEIHGRVGALIALGAGFNPILTGRENIRVNASVLGLSKQQIDDRIDDIVDFADLSEFIDSPLRNYSSGMQVRLGFSIATVLDPDVLILDEVLAVGDASFRHKCYHRINRLIKNAAVILVSHSMDYIAAMSQRVGLMERGQFTLYPDTFTGIAEYFERNRNDNTLQEDGGSVSAVYPPIEFAQVRLPSTSICYSDPLRIELEVHSSQPIDDVLLSFCAVNEQEQTVMAWQTTAPDERVNIPKGKSLCSFSIDPLLLHEGRYKWNFGLLRNGSIEHLVWMMRAGEFEVRSEGRRVGNIPYLPKVIRPQITCQSPLPPYRISGSF